MTIDEARERLMSIIPEHSGSTEKEELLNSEAVSLALECMSIVDEMSYKINNMWNCNTLEYYLTSDKMLKIAECPDFDCGNISENDH